MKQIYLIILVFITSNIGWSQTPVFEIPKAAPLDSLFQIIFTAYELDEDAISRAQKYGWYKHSEKINADSFFIFTKQYCIDRVGEDYFYEHFRFFGHSFKDDPFSEVFQITYRYYPLGFNENDYVEIIFQSLDFLNVHQESFPNNLPDCSTNAADCEFPINRKAVFTIANKEIVKERKVEISINKLTADFKWSCHVSSDGTAAGETFLMDARTGEITDHRKFYRY